MRAAPDVCLRGLEGGGGCWGGLLLSKIQGTKGVDGWVDHRKSEPEVVASAKRGAAGMAPGPPGQDEPTMHGHSLLADSSSLLSSQREAGQARAGVSLHTPSPSLQLSCTPSASATSPPGLNMAS